MAQQYSFNNKQTPLNLSKFFSNTIVIMIILIFVIILILNAVFLQPLFQLGVNVIHDMQVGFPSKVFQQFMNIFSIICNTPVIAVIFLLQMGIVKQKIKPLIHLSFFILGFYFIAVLKQAYQQSRPIWVSSQINKYQWLCPTDFGNPSGHSYVAFPLFQPIINKYYGFQNLKVAWIFLIFFGIVVPYSRMYLGVHSLNQVFFGLSFGLIWIVLYRYGLRRIFYIVFAKMLKLKKIPHLAVAICINIFLIIIPLIIFSIRKYTPLADFDMANLNRICQSDLTSDKIQSSMLGLCILASPVFGFMYGFFALKYEKNVKLYFSGQWYYRSVLSCILHCLVQILTAGAIPAIIILGIGSVWKQPYSKFIVSNISLILGGILYIWLTPIIERKWKWIKYEEDQQGLNLQVKIYKTSQNLNIMKNMQEIDTRKQ